MKFNDVISIVGRNLMRRKGRTILTAVGVTIGTASIVAMVSLGIGLKDSAIKSVSRFGSLTEIEVYQNYGPDYDQSRLKLNSEAVQKLKSIEGVAAVLPKIRYNGMLELTYRRKTANVQVVGVDVKEGQKFGYNMAEGVYFKRGRNDGVITYALPEMFFEKEKRSSKNKKNEMNFMYGYRDPNKATRENLVNKTITMTIAKQSGANEAPQTKDYNIKITGMLEKTGMDMSGTLYLPIEQVINMNKWAGFEMQPNGRRTRGNEVIYENITVKATGRETVDKVTEEIKKLGYSAYSFASQLKEINSAFMIIELILGGIGAISLLVASISIVNTMIMSILERTKQIGVMKVLGATIPNIRSLFIMEAGAIGFFGGVLGIVFAYGIVGLVNMIAKSSNFSQSISNGGPPVDIASTPIWLALFGLTFAFVIGLIAGIYPAIRAAKLSPLNAIRQE